MKKKIMILGAALALAFSWSMVACAQPITMPDGTAFDAEYYAQANPDVAAACGTNAILLYQHYIKFGKAEGRMPVSGGSRTNNTSWQDAAGEFDASFYAKTYPDVVAICGTDPAALYQHYIQFGKAEGRTGKENGEEQNEKYEQYTDNGKRVLELVNEERRKAGLSTLSWDDTIAKAADVRASELPREFSHTRPDGRSCFTALEEVGIKNVYMGENIAMGYKTPEDVMTGWMNSSGHRANILKQNYKRMAVGYNNGYWVQLFAS